MLLTTNTLQKTFLIKQGNHTGTAFAVEVEGKQYLATAKHVVPDPSEQPKVMHAETWKDLPFNSIFHHPGEPDIAVITLNQQIAPSHPVELSSAGLSLGQNMIILGFPFGWNYTQYDINNGWRRAGGRLVMKTELTWRSSAPCTPVYNGQTLALHDPLIA